ncbi:MAG: ribonuclease III [Myxococcales bacterium]|nr:ribonuclease III [Myxococcales bacterium]MCB9734933.1 ribonuclease III [Deltaproteobacteria bacterium]
MSDHPVDPIPTAEVAPSLEGDVLGYAFTDRALLVDALTHASFVNEVAGGAATSDYERLEFLGDAVFELAVSELLFRRLPTAREGRLTQLRSKLVNARTLAQVATRVGIAPHIRMGRGEERSGGRARSSILSDVLEALIGAVYCDGGFGAAVDVVARLLGPRLDELLLRGALVKDPKSRLQEWAQQHLAVTPTYALLEVSGPDHDASFSVAVQVADYRFEGHGRAKKEAEQEAARVAYAALAAPPGAGDAPEDAP